jgi:membrane protein YdbS with pleckstrin-like domain
VANGWERVLWHWLRIPPEPATPDGSPESVLVFRAGRNYFRWRLVQWAQWQLVLVGLVFVVEVMRWKNGPKLSPLANEIWVGVELLALLVFLLWLVVSYQVERLNYEQTWYIVTDRSLRIRSGIWGVKEMTMTFANIQNIQVTAGPLEGFLGLANVEVSSAGGGVAVGHGVTMAHKAVFAGVANAAELRDLLVERLRVYRGAGLGEVESAKPVPAGNAVDAAHELLREARALRAVVAPRP